MNETLWKHKNKKWQPVDKQAALIVRKASWLLGHTSPPDAPVNQKKQEAARLEAESEQRKRRIEVNERIEHAIQVREAIKLAELKRNRKPQVYKFKWLAKWEQRKAKAAGLPKPDWPKLRAMQKAQPNYGKVLSPMLAKPIHYETQATVNQASRE